MLGIICSKPMYPWSFVATKRVQNKTAKLQPASRVNQSIQRRAQTATVKGIPSHIAKHLSHPQTAKTPNVCAHRSLDLPSGWLEEKHPQCIHILATFLPSLLFCPRLPTSTAFITVMPETVKQNNAESCQITKPRKHVVMPGWVYIPRPSNSSSPIIDLVSSSLSFSYTSAQGASRCCRCHEVMAWVHLERLRKVHLNLIPVGCLS